MDGISQDVSDIHIECFQSYATIRFRTDGVLQSRSYDLNGIFNGPGNMFEPFWDHLSRTGSMVGPCLDHLFLAFFEHPPFKHKNAC